MKNTKTVTVKQYEALGELKKLYRMLSNNPNSLWDYSDPIYVKVSDMLEYAVVDALVDSGLPPISIPSISAMPNREDFFEMLTEEEREVWSNRCPEDPAKEWAEETGAYAEYCRLYSDICGEVESYLTEYEYCEIEDDLDRE